jgi:hypothetical protein
MHDGAVGFTTMLRATSTAMMLRATAVRREQETWRDHKITYLQYCNVATETLHAVLKPKAAGKYNKFSQVDYRAQMVDSSGIVIPRDDIPNTTASFGRGASSNTGSAAH